MYLITEMFFFLLVTAVLGAIVGWLAKGLLVARHGRKKEETWRLELRRSEARAGNLKNQLAEAFLVEERLREELTRSDSDPTLMAGGEDLEALQAEIARRDKKIEILKLQVTQSEAALASEWQSLGALKSEIAERQQRLEDRGKQVSGKLRSSEEAQQRLRLQLRNMKRQSDRLQEELATSQQALAEERQESAARVEKLKAKLDEQETLIALLDDAEESAPTAEPSTPEEPATATEELATTPVDDLQRIRGIGPVLRRRLNEIGVTSFRQIAAWTDDDVIEVARQIGSAPGRIRKGGWVETARELAVRG